MLQIRKHEYFSDVELIILLVGFFRCMLLTWMLTHVGWSDGIGLGFESVLLLEVSGSIPTGANLGGLI